LLNIASGVGHSSITVRSDGRPSVRFDWFRSGPPSESHTLGDGQDEQALALMRRANFFRRK
jgi:hypothetical protein